MGRWRRRGLILCGVSQVDPHTHRARQTLLIVTQLCWIMNYSQPESGSWTNSCMSSPELSCFFSLSRSWYGKRSLFILFERMHLIHTWNLCAIRLPPQSLPQRVNNSTAYVTFPRQHARQFFERRMRHCVFKYIHTSSTVSASWIRVTLKLLNQFTEGF